MDCPLTLLQQWITQEQQKGTADARCAVLATAHRENAAPHARIVAIREVTADGLLFFTQRGSRKVAEIQSNPQGALTFWFPLHEREVMLEGSLTPISADENQRYWQDYPRIAQIRFYSYAPTSGQSIDSKQQLEAKKQGIENDYQGKDLPLHPDYCGFRLRPQRVVFYSYRTDELSDVIEYQWRDENWQQQCLSP